MTLIKVIKEKWLAILGFCIVGIAVYIIVNRVVTEQYAVQKCEDDPFLDELKENLKQFLLQDKNWTGYLKDMDGKKIYQQCSICKDRDTYTINKKHIFLCMKDDEDEYYEKHQLMYALLHELGHVICDEIGHTKKYNDIFQQLKQEAHNFGIYDINYKPSRDYCNINRTYKV
jgi:hypothetical protein